MNKGQGAWGNDDLHILPGDLYGARRLPYLEAALKESLRLFPPAPTIIRKATRAMDLGGHRVLPGQWLAVAAYSMHRNPAYWQVRVCAFGTP